MSHEKVQTSNVFTLSVQASAFRIAVLHYARMRIVFDGPFGILIENIQLPWGYGDRSIFMAGRDIFEFPATRPVIQSEVLP